MCGRFNLIATSEQTAQHFSLRRLLHYETSFNIPPGQKILTVVKLEDGSRKGVYLWWGLIPSWSKDARIGQRLINARVETLREKPSFGSAFKQRRCLIPATGFYEWQKTGADKQTFHVHREDNTLFAFAGLWEYWEHEGHTLYSCTIITTAASQIMQPIHERMPVIVPHRDYRLWLGKDCSEDEVYRSLSNDAYRDMIATPVSDWVNNPRHNDERCIRSKY